MYKTITFIFAAVFIGVLIFARSYPEPPVAKSGDLKFSEASCWFEKTADIQARCGQMVVSGLHQSYQLPVVILETEKSNEATDRAAATGIPLMYLGGGPGSGLGLELNNIDYWFGWYRRQALNVPLILMDYRSTGLATPNFSCAPFLRAYQQSIVAKENQEAADLYRTTRQCIDIWRQRGFHESDFSSYALAQDIVSMADSLGYNTINLYGVSFGTRVAMMAASMRPDLINRMILDSPVYVNREGIHYWPQTFSGAIDRYFKGCSRENNCVISETEFLDSLARLKANAMEVSIRRWDQPGRWQLQVDDHLFISSFFSSLYNPETLFRFEFIGEGAMTNQKEAMSKLMEWYVNELLQPHFNYFVYYASRCLDSDPFDQAIYDQGYSQSRWQTYLSYESQYDVCSTLDRESVSRNLRLQDIHTPAWVLAGSLDPITPAENTRLLSQALGNATLLEFKQAGHGVFNSQACLAGRLSELLSADTDLRKRLGQCASLIEE